MAAGATYTPLGTTTVSGFTTSVVTFSSIPSTYTDLVVIVSGTAYSARNYYIRFNSDTSTNYSYTVLQGDAGSGANSYRASSTDKGYVGYLSASGNESTTIISVQNYANTTTYKTWISRQNDNDVRVGSIIGLWRKTPEAINTLEVYFSPGAFNPDSTVTLYGIAAA